MAGEWIFKQLRRGDKDRQPTQGEFFATDAIRTEAEALVRESVQNSLDAALNISQEPVKVRFHLATGINALPNSITKKYFASGWPHFRAKENGLDDIPQDNESCPFLVIEDFGTKGLIGNTKQWRHEQGTNNPFYYFFRTEGRSNKSESDRGRWGIGKYVFPRSSRINAFIALTIRADDSQRLIMGQAILKSHNVGSSFFTPDGDFGGEKDEELVLPINDADFANNLSQDFSLARKNESGLSVVIPWIKPSITRESLITALIEDYFYPILDGILTASLSDENGNLEITKETIFHSSTTSQMNSNIGPLLELARWSLQIKESQVFKLHPPEARPHWDSAMIPSLSLDEIKNRYRSGERLAIEVPLTVREKGREPVSSFFRIFLENDGEAEGYSIFIRDGIIISDVRPRRVPGVRSIVVIEDRPLAALLGDSENPAHTQWQKDRAHFSTKYTYGKSYIDFVSQSVYKFITFINAQDEEPDRDLLRDIFFIPKPPTSESPKEKFKPRKRNKGEIVKPEIEIEPTRRRYALSKTAGGFTITHGHPESEFPSRLEVTVAYDRRRGSPLKKYLATDFELNKEPISIETTGANVSHCKFNRLHLQNLQPDFRVIVKGFDENRDLYVSVKPKEIVDDTPI